IAERQKAGEPEDFHAGGSDCSGIVWAVGKDVRNVKVGDEVVVHSGWWRPDDPWVKSGKDPMLAESTRIWGYQTNYGSFCQFARCQAHQCVAKPKRLTWEEAGCFLLCASTTYRMLMGWPPHVVEPGDVVLVWGAAGGLGSMALEITRAAGGRAAACGAATRAARPPARPPPPPAPPPTLGRWPSAITGCARSASRAATSPTTRRPPTSRSSSAKARWIRVSATPTPSTTFRSATSSCS